VAVDLSAAGRKFCEGRIGRIDRKILKRANEKGELDRSYLIGKSYKNERNINGYRNI
jgi:hypothetical protein